MFFFFYPIERENCKGLRRMSDETLTETFQLRKKVGSVHE